MTQRALFEHKKIESESQIWLLIFLNYFKWWELVGIGGKEYTKYLTLPSLYHIIIYQWKENKVKGTASKQNITCNQGWLNRTKLSVITSYQ